MSSYSVIDTNVWKYKNMSMHVPVHKSRATTAVFINRNMRRHCVGKSQRWCVSSALAAGAVQIEKKNWTLKTMTLLVKSNSPTKMESWNETRKYQRLANENRRGLKTKGERLDGSCDFSEEPSKHPFYAATSGRKKKKTFYFLRSMFWDAGKAVATLLQRFR